MNYLRMDIKVCEGCGALWLRAQTADGIYCKTCRARLSALPAAKGRRRPLGPRKPRLAALANGGAR
jgi:hypothetical protein